MQSFYSFTFLSCFACFTLLYQESIKLTLNRFQQILILSFYSLLSTLSPQLNRIKDSKNKKDKKK